MTAEEAENIYYEAYRKASKSDGITPFSQTDARRSAWQAVIEAVQQECTVDFVHRYFNAKKLNGDGVPDEREGIS